MIMRTSQVVCLCLALFVAVSVNGASKNPADYPLRLHIFDVNQTTFFHNRSVDQVGGDGRGNLFENSEARGADFSFSCGEKVRPSFGFETYPARWKKQNEELVVLFPVFGKSNAYFTCNLKLQLKTYAYLRLNGRMESMPTAQYKAWMVRNDYDPEHGKEAPTRMKPQRPPDPGPPSAII
jgi:hypothetical protein